MVFAHVKAGDGVVLAVDCSAEFFNRSPWNKVRVVAVERVIGKDVLVDNDVGGELAAGGFVASHAVRAIRDGGKTVKFFGGADLVTAVNQLRGDRHNGRCCNSVCYPNKGCCQ